MDFSLFNNKTIILGQSVLAQVVIAWIYGHLLEYLLHKFVLHNFKFFFTKPAFRSHFRTHHFYSRRLWMADKKYQKFKLALGTDFEQRSLIFLSLFHFPIIFIWPWAYLVICWSLGSYYVIHTLQHRYPSWGRKYFPWHYDHHLSPDQHKNWGVRLPIFDYIFNTRRRYAATHKEAQDMLAYLQKSKNSKRALR